MKITREQLAAMIEAGVSRIGTSASVAIVSQLDEG
jgi:deoxyribose-phosphate aldolase